MTRIPGEMITILSFAIAIDVAFASATDLVQGKTLHEANCVTCHDSRIYTRPDHRTTSLDALRHRVQYCQEEIGEEWTAPQVDDVTAYLNHNFYHFKSR